MPGSGSEVLAVGDPGAQTPVPDKGDMPQTHSAARENQTEEPSQSVFDAHEKGMREMEKLRIRSLEKPSLWLSPNQSTPHVVTRHSIPRRIQHLKAIPSLEKPSSLLSPNQPTPHVVTRHSIQGKLTEDVSNTDTNTNPHPERRLAQQPPGWPENVTDSHESSALANQAEPSGFHRQPKASSSESTHDRAPHKITIKHTRF